MPTLPAIMNEVRSIRRSALRTLFGVVILTSGIVPAFAVWWDFDQNGPWYAQLSTFWAVAGRTYPLTVSIAVIAMSRQLGWFKFGRFFFMGAVITFGVYLSSLFASVTGQSAHNIQAANIIATPDHPLFGPLTDSFNYLAGYYKLYGPRDFLASILVGSFLGRTTSKVLRKASELEQQVRDDHQQEQVAESADRRTAA